MLTSTLNLIFAWALFGLIWVIQLVHYPSFSYIAEKDFLVFHQHHTTSITMIVMPLMLAELALSGYLAMQQKWDMTYLVPFILVLLIWASTFFIQIPLHNQLDAGKDLKVIQKLVNSNWIRTLLWTIKAVLVSYYFLKKSTL